MNRRRRRPVSGPRRDLLVTLAVFGVLVLAGGLSLQARSGLPGDGSFTIVGGFSDLANLRDHDDVRIAGVRVGQVLHVRRDDDRSVVDLKLDQDLHLPVDTQAVVRSRGVLGSRFLELRPGVSARTLDDGGAIALRRATAGRDLTDVIETFTPQARSDVRGVLRGSARGLLTRGGDLNDLIATTPDAVQDVARIASAINARSGAAARLVPSLQAASAAIDPVAQALARTIGAQGDAAQPFADGREDVRATLRSAPRDLAGTRAGLRRSDPLLLEAQALSRTLERTLRPAPAALRATRDLLSRTKRPLRRAATLLDEATRAAPPLARLLAAVPPSLTMLDDTVRDATPLVRKVAAIQCDIHSFATGWQSMLGIAVKNDKGDPQLGPLTSLRLTVTPTPDTLNPAITALTDDTTVGSNPYPAPCQAGTERLG